MMRRAVSGPETIVKRREGTDGRAAIGRKSLINASRFIRRASETQDIFIFYFYFYFLMNNEKANSVATFSLVRHCDTNDR